MNASRKLEYEGLRYLSDAERKMVLLHKQSRDKQRRRLYAWERLTLLERHALLSGPLSTKRATAAATAFGTEVWCAERERYGRHSVPAPEFQVSGRKHPGAAHATLVEHRIVLGRCVCVSCEVILHELAHVLMPAKESHGEEFVGVLIGLLSRHTQRNADALVQSAKAHGLRVAAGLVDPMPPLAPALAPREIVTLSVPAQICADSDSVTAADVTASESPQNRGVSDNVTVQCYGPVERPGVRYPVWTWRRARIVQRNTESGDWQNRGNTLMESLVDGARFFAFLDHCSKCGATIGVRHDDCRTRVCGECARTAALERQRNRRSKARKVSDRCAHCGEPMEAQRSTRKYCSSACRVAALRERTSEPRASALACGVSALGAAASTPAGTS